jgi:hypothetical protein
MRLSENLTATRIQKTNLFFHRDTLSRKTVRNTWNVHFSFNWPCFLIDTVIRSILIIAILGLLPNTDFCILIVVPWSWSTVIHWDLIWILCIQSIFEYWLNRVGPLAHWRSAVIAVFKTISNSRLIPRLFKLLRLTYIINLYHSIRICCILNWLVDWTLKIL